jgi:hypothetical protein
MTHSLHRLGDKESLRNDYVVFALTAAGVYGKVLGHAAGSTPNKRRFLEIVAKHGAVNIGVSPTHDRRRLALAAGYDLQQLEEAVCDQSEIYSVFTDIETVGKVFEELKRDNLGLSVVASGIFDEVFRSCNEVSLSPHSVNMSAGIMGKTALLPRRTVLELITMCGHGLVSSHLAEHVIERVKKKGLTPEAAAKILSKQCLCGIFNPTRAAELVKRAMADNTRQETHQSI